MKLNEETNIKFKIETMQNIKYILYDFKFNVCSESTVIAYIANNVFNKNFTNIELNKIKDILNKFNLKLNKID